MKVLKIVLGILAVLVLGFFAMGLLNPTVSYTTEVEVNKPLKESWAVFTDDEKADQWIEGLKSFELVSGTKDEVGAVHKITMEHDGETMEMTEKLTAIKEMEQYALEFDNDVMINNVDIRFSAKDDNTTIITADSNVNGKGIFMRSMFALMKGTFKTHSDEMYTKLKKLIEENTTDYYPAPEMEADLMEETVPAKEQVQ